MNDQQSKFKRWFADFKEWFLPHWRKFRVRQKAVWKRFQITRWIIAILLTLFLIISVYLTVVAKTADVSNLKADLSQNTEVYDKDGDSAGSLYSQKGTYISLDKISPNIQNAVLSTEDRNFYHEHGFSVKGIARAALMYAKNKILGNNYISGGGSTLTQQLVKNAYLTQEQTFTRKAKEIFLSIEVENVYSKKDILTMYLNNAYFGNGVWGVQDASKRYFNKNASELTNAQSAVLAGMLTSPSGYDPVAHPDASKQRRNLVLQLMVENNKLTQSEADAAKKTALTVTDGYESSDSYKYPYYFDAVIDEAVNTYHISEEDIMNKDYKIYTTLDQNEQKDMQDTFDDDDNFPSDSADGTIVQAASIAINPNNGGILAVVGGRGDHVFRGFNRATQMKRQPGSAIKPIAVYTPALEHGYYYDSMLTDKKKSYGTDNYTPKNYDDTYSGSVAMYKALAQSLNAPAVWLLNKIGINRGYESVKKFGLPVTSKDKNLALALGGLSTGVSPQQLATAYTAFANDGKLASAHYITKIVDASGKTIVSNQNPKKKQIISKKVAKAMTSMLIGVFSDGTGKTAKPSGYTVAGKTGSTSSDVVNGQDSERDKWIVGYTPDVVVATWEGYDTTDASHVLPDSSYVNTNTLFKTEMEDILPNTKGTDFDTQDAATLANNDSSSSSNIWDEIQNGTSQVGDKISQGADSISGAASDLWSKAKSIVGQ
ncbi:PBP1A family penicillin-binding protein [Paucilactobacillus nenjiangensis]|jgi:penicillin-binding protein 2A|uniref:PBP1A family penicillin-binding protein n=2 Tax=Paucilactobacillus nenjiangensis TaxID=1296540 RepID=A0A5P1X2Z4_9LACO|nr:PBP1A family penicillin-binding protein [Paucilactobacillus nenjiangensis]QER67264.1 PBP1A family penicillin-binding protein [Paucilactobacillus nenjiangensis]